MDQRKYNIYFHTHTISGIISAALLFVIFFAGSFSFFKKDITAWQQGVTEAQDPSGYHYQVVLDSLQRKHTLLGRDVDFYLVNGGNDAYVNMSTSKDTTISKPDAAAATKPGRRGGTGDSENFIYSFPQKTSSTYDSGYNMGEFLYRLHFLAPLNVIPIHIGRSPFGYLLAGVTSFLFLFALITGLFLHWDKIKSNFYLFRPWSKWKTVWTDMHTVLGVIGFPFQFVFAVTGIVLIVNFLLITPFATVLYDGDQEKVFNDIQYSRSIQVDYTYSPLAAEFQLDTFIEGALKRWEGSSLSRIHIRNFGDQSMRVLLELKPNYSKAFAGSGIVYQEIATGKMLEEKSPHDDANYIDGVRSVIYRLHFGDFGGRPLQVVFFVLGMMGCLVILSGIMIWLVGRDKVNVPAYKRKFNFWAANVFVSASMAMLPVTAFTFTMLKVLPVINQSVLYRTYFYSWLVLGLYFLLLRNLATVNRHAWIISAVACFAVPISNGLCTGMWLWNSWSADAESLVFIDTLFLILAIVSAIAYFQVRKVAKPFHILKKK